MSFNFDYDAKCIISSIDDEINNKLNNYVNSITPLIQSDSENSWLNYVFGLHNMNEGINYNILFDKSTLLSENQKFIINTAYDLLVENGFNVDKNNGLLNIDIYHIDSAKPVSTKYGSYCNDNDISNVEYDTCVFYTQKDKGVNGDLIIHTTKPKLLSKDTTQIIKTKSNMVILRNGDCYYDFEPHNGLGKEHIISVHFEKNNIEHDD